MPPYQVLILTDKEDRDFRNSAELHFSQANIDTATAPAEPVDALLLPGENIDRPLHQLRSGQWHWPADIPAFTLGKAHPLADGDYTQLSEQLANWLTQYQQRRAQLAQLPEAIAPLERFLQYAWPRPGFTLRAQWQLSQHSNYHYPILRALGLDDEQRLLQQWQQQEVLESTELLDRVRQCPHCHSEQINFVDTCPSCKSIDIHSTIALHCFTCGHVGEQRQFQQDNALRCPTCLTQLRHIGVDYDRPLERFACNSCQQRFIEGEVVGRCPNGHASNPSELLERRIYHYRLGPGADQFASSGRVFDNRALQWGESVSLENFSWLLRWNNASARRHRHQHLLLFLNWAGIGQAI
ncbi:MAG: hypothetical protein OIF38_16670, partial [Cellvibrionaceae bacterium]|nr:hypothetical protein [Cellvibrionaceae bacterium]